MPAAVAVDPIFGVDLGVDELTFYMYDLVSLGEMDIGSGNVMISYAGGTITIFEDAGTTADYALPGTFFDGTAILSGTFFSLDRTMFTATLGSAIGEVDWTGGTRLNDMMPQDQTGWPFFTGINAMANQVVEGYDEAWDGKVEPHDPIVPNETINWSELKSRF